ncbi:helix-turn-helix domain-containing protein, partial [Pseudomonas sp. PM2]|uniref:helix-turn-helix domain-containing protein n=1 Tax=Pseudomonas sp. PM2 TaxID=215172 RepID=UPI003FA2C3E9
MPKSTKSIETGEAPAGHIQSLEKGLRILDEIVSAPAPVKLAEIIKRFDMDKASA